MNEYKEKFIHKETWKWIKKWALAAAREVFAEKRLRQLEFLILEKPYGCRILYKYYESKGSYLLGVYVAENSVCEIMRCTWAGGASPRQSLNSFCEVLWIDFAIKFWLSGTSWGFSRFCMITIIRIPDERPASSLIRPSVSAFGKRVFRRRRNGWDLEVYDDLLHRHACLGKISELLR